MTTSKRSLDRCQICSVTDADTANMLTDTRVPDDLDLTCYGDKVRLDSIVHDLVMCEQCPRRGGK